MKQIPGISCVLIYFLLYSLPAFSQISGIVNQYQEVLSIDYTVNSVEVLNPASFATSDRVLLIQMKGALMDQSNSSTFGDIININGAGLYEMATVCDVIGNDVLFSYGIKNTYNPLSSSNARVQLVKVHTGTDETVSATLTAQNWNGTTGGVVAIELSGTLTLNADIDVSEQGFRGGDRYLTGYTCNFATPSPSYFYNAASERGAEKGEGIADFITGKRYGKGHQANGGGGGNDHNSGGGGGGNYAAGGIGGIRDAGIFDCKGNHPGLAGGALSGLGYSITNNQVFLGGGGGAGEDNNIEGRDAGNGGGIVLIIADQIEGNGNAIRSNGGSVPIGGSDGTGGGGAGGTILLSTNGYGATALNLTASGGEGGTTTINAEGPGGGGAGGVVWVATGLPGLVTTDVSGGIAGTAVANGTSNGATAGSPGIVQSPLTIPEEIVNTSPCVLNSSVKFFGEMTPQHTARLFWDQFSIADLEQIEVERKTGATSFSALADIDSRQLEWMDFRPGSGENIYRLKFVYKDGSRTYSNQVALFKDNLSQLELQLSPNPVHNNENLSLQFYLPRAGHGSISLWDLPGRKIQDIPYEGLRGDNHTILPLTKVPAGTYFVRVDFLGQSEIRKIFVRK